MEWESAVASHRLQLTTEFFDHVENLIHASHQDKQQREGMRLPDMHALPCLANVSLMTHLHPAVTLCTADMADIAAIGLSLHCLAFHAISFEFIVKAAILAS